MMVSNRGSVFGLVRWQSKNVLIYACAGAVAAGVHVLIGWDWLIMPVVPLTVVGAALGIFVSFRTNSAYDRWWEGRKLWGRMVNTSRMFATQATTYIDDPEVAARLVRRQAAYVHLLRVVLRRQDAQSDEGIARNLSPEEHRALAEHSNPTHWLLQTQQRELTRLAKDGAIDALQLQSFDRSIMHLLDIQGGCERIKATPLPKGYGFIAETLIQYFSLLFPFTVVAELGLLVIPANVLVCLSFMLISEAGRVLEDPFTMFFNGLPLTQLSTMIEVNLRETLGHEDLPALVTPDERGILM